MAMTLMETETELVYETAEGTMITIKKDDDNIEVCQKTPVSHANGQTWRTLKAYLDAKLLESQ